MAWPPAPLDDALTDASPGTPDAHAGYHNDERTAINDTVTEVEAHEADTTAVHGIADTAALVITTDGRLSNPRPPNGAAGGALSGSFPNPGFAVDMATQAELDAVAATIPG